MKKIALKVVVQHRENGEGISFLLRFYLDINRWTSDFFAPLSSQKKWNYTIDAPPLKHNESCHGYFSFRTHQRL